MNRNALKNYAPQARRDFIAAVTDRAASYGLRQDRIEPMITQGNVVLIAGTSIPQDIATKRKRLEDRITRHGFEPTMEAIAYTWFNRFAAIRFMELHGYLEHGYRVLSHPDSDKLIPEILEHAAEVELPGLNQNTVIELKLDGTRDPELYRMVVLAQCNALHAAMPFLFERIDDETELLLPENLLHSDSLIRKLVNGVDEDDWQDVEIIGWLYQFYIAEKKDQVIGKVVKSEDIPAATQLFTPNWIVKYLVQNSLGRQWLATYPDSPLKQQMEFYIEPAEQTPEVQAQLQAITPESLNPEELTLLDPACGSGHILVEAYDLFKAIYQERGYRARDIPSLILQKNLFGLEIDDRAAQLAAFALMMKARADDRRIFANGVQPHVLAIQESQGLNAQQITEALNIPILKTERLPSEYLFEELEEERAPLFSRKNLSVKGDIAQEDVAQLIALFEHGKTFGSLIRVPENVAEKLPAIAERVQDVLAYGGMLEQAAARSFLPIVEQALMLAYRCDFVIMNPPYLNSKGMSLLLKDFANDGFPRSKTDTFAMFLERSFSLCKHDGQIGLMSPFVWMFLSKYQPLREILISDKSILSLIHPEYHAFFESAYVPICAFIVHNAQRHLPGEYIDLRRFYGADVQPARFLEAAHDRHCKWRYTISTDRFSQLPGQPIVYWAPDRVFNLFASAPSLGSLAQTRKGMGIGNNDRFVRYWYEVSNDGIFLNASSRKEAEESGQRWFPYNDGGPLRRWYGNNLSVVNWKCDGHEAKKSATERNNGRHWSRYLVSLDYFFRPGVTWTAISSGAFGARLFGKGFLFSSAGMCLFAESNDLLQYLLAVLNSQVGQYILSMLSPTLNYGAGDIGRFPVRRSNSEDQITDSVARLVEIAQKDWDASEVSWDFSKCPLLTNARSRHENTVQGSLSSLEEAWDDLRREACHLQSDINRQIAVIYDLEQYVNCLMSKEDVTLREIAKDDETRQLVSYAIGCMMGRYSLDKPGLIYAHSSNQGFDPSQYSTFPADSDGIIPIMEADWFPDDASNRLVEFISVAWSKDHLAENLTFIAESLGPNRSEQPQETIRRYFATGFYKHHLQLYKRRPIYWLFSSGKQRAFQCLVYLHRYHEGTLARMRTEYVIPLQGKIAARIDQLADDITAASSTAYRKKLEKERETLRKQHTELQAFDEQLRHYADQRIRLDLDDGVKVNYGKFGNLLAEVKAVTGGSEES